MELKDSQTIELIRQSLHSESLAITRYLIYAENAKKLGRHDDAALFEKMARNEMEHAKIWFRYLYPVSSKIDNCLEESAQNENNEWKEMYPTFAKVAKKEGFLDIATLFERIASIECDHERRFLEQILLDKKKEPVSVNTQEQKCYCLFCGFASHEKLSICPVCEAIDSFE